MYSELVYDYECRTVTPDEAAAMLGGAPKDNPHDADDACPAWEPLRVIFDHKGRLLLGTDELAHIVGAGRPMDAAIYHEPARPRGPRRPRRESRRRTGETIMTTARPASPTIRRSRSAGASSNCSAATTRTRRRTP